MAIYLVVGLIGAMWAAAVASGKNLNVAVFAILGFLFPLIGVLIAYGTKGEAPKEAAPQ
jgi:drug/metabolite transporter (DMT)-like permease